MLVNGLERSCELSDRSEFGVLLDTGTFRTYAAEQQFETLAVLEQGVLARIEKRAGRLLVRQHCRQGQVSWIWMGIDREFELLKRMPSSGCTVCSAGTILSTLLESGLKSVIIIIITTTIIIIIIITALWTQVS